MTKPFMQSDWMAAYHFCKRNKLELFTLESLDEAQHVFDILNNNVDAFDPMGMWLQSWMGMASNEMGSPTNWNWMTTGKKINFDMPWADGQPNNNEAVQPVLQHCGAIILASAFGFNDRNCYLQWEATAQFICQDVKSSGRGFDINSGMPGR